MLVFWDTKRHKSQRMKKKQLIVHLPCTFFESITNGYIGISKATDLP